MYYRNNIDETLYAEHMDLLKKMNKEYIEIRRGQEYKIGMAVQNGWQFTLVFLEIMTV